MHTGETGQGDSKQSMGAHMWAKESTKTKTAKTKMFMNVPEPQAGVALTSRMVGGDIATRKTFFASQSYPQSYPSRLLSPAPSFGGDANAQHQYDCCLPHNFIEARRQPTARGTKVCLSQRRPPSQQDTQEQRRPHSHPQPIYHPQQLPPSPRQFQSPRHWSMDDTRAFPFPAGGYDDSYWNEEFGGEFFPGFSQNVVTNNDTRLQTPTENYVSASSAGKELDPSHHQGSDSSPTQQLDQQFWTPFSSTAVCPSEFNGNFDPRAYPSNAAFDSVGAGLHGFSMSDGLPSSFEPTMLPVFGELPGYSRVSPTGTAYSSFSSSGASDAMASMTLEPMATQPSDVTNGSTTFANGSGAASVGSPNWNFSCPPTVSPKNLRMVPSPCTTSSNDSITSSVLATAENHSSFLSTNKYHNMARPSCELRPALPSKRLPSNGNKARKELPDVPGSRASSSRRNSSSECFSKKVVQPLAHRIKPAGPDPIELVARPPNTSPVPRPPSPAASEKARKDAYLVKSKLAGMTYRKIKEKGNFIEAESTLRGRFRMLTKAKEARVRKPEWEEEDIRLLKKFIHKSSKGGDLRSAKIPWKQVADYIADHGGSYHFGNATCRKKWDELVDQGKA